MSSISVIISSYNQKKRLRHCLDSAVNMKCKFADNVEIILADDNSTDGSIELIKQYPVKLCLGKHKNHVKYTLADNWNNAVTMATGDRVLFTNGDHILTTWFADHHMDPIMRGNIIFGPAYQTQQQAESIIVRDKINYIDVIKECESNSMLTQDRRSGHQQGSALTYNKDFDSTYPYGYNFSVERGHFLTVGGFDSLDKWGGEEETLCNKIVEKYPETRIVSNCNSVAIHLWHPPLNLINRKTGILSDYSF